MRGVGLWTCQMFMMFTLKRPDVLPTGDLGVQKGMAALYGGQACRTSTETRDCDLPACQRRFISNRGLGQALRRSHVF